MAQVGSAFAQASGRARRVFEVLDSEEVVEERPGAVDLRKLPDGGVGEVRFEHVTVGYEAGRPVLQDISLRARPGEVVAFVGRTGAGKSTLVSLLPRFLDPWEGRVTVGGQDIRDLRLSSLRSQIGLVLQDSFLLSMSVADNIAYGRPEATREEIVAAARAANAEEFIQQLPDGYDTVLGERGATLSGGQSQRLSIARALLKDAPILILDEPTSALDAETEALLLSALKRLVAGRTTFIIAHRLSTIRHADQIILLDDGRIAERGSHGELLSADGAYARFHRTQYLSGNSKESAG
jgi:ATP-binding cassette subfamily B protein/subfamily B ATP-binding cassette protein MsbA